MAGNNKSGARDAVPNSKMLRRTLALLVVCGIASFLVLGIKLFQVQVLKHDFYEAKAIEQQVRDTTVSARRGTIFDTNGKILAMSASVDTIYISPRELMMYDLLDPDDSAKKGVTREFIAQGLSDILGVTAESILQKMEDTSRWYMVISRKVEPEISDRVRAFKNDNNLKGVKIEEDTKRYYPYSSLASQVIGFVGTDNIGLSGLESVYNDQLTGVNGRVVRAKNAVGTDMLFTSFEDYYDAVDGCDTYITIDSTIQYYMEKALEQAVIDYDVRQGAGAIAMNVKTGAVLGMVSLNNFDLNNYQDVSEDIQAEIDAEPDKDVRAQMLRDAQLAQWRNKTINDTYEPGSTFKIITLAMALNENVVSVDDNFYCGGSLNLPGRTSPLNCWKYGGHGNQTLTQALQHSCNVAFVNVGLKVGAENFYNYCEAFGFFDTKTSKDVTLSGKTGIDLVGESGSIWWSENSFKNPDNKTQLYAASFGQTFNITPLQLITAVSACVNGGYLMKPYLVREVDDAEGNVVSKTEPTVVRQVISEATSATIRGMLEQVVGGDEGTGKNAAVAGYRIGGKTGTSTNTVVEAQTGKKEYIVSFIGVAPINDPEIAIIVFLDCPSSATGIYISGGQMAAPVAGKMFSDILPYMGIEPQFGESEEKVRDKSVPGITGLNLSDAQAKLSGAGFTYRVIGSGATVTGQLPIANSIIAADSQVIIYCDALPSEGEATMPDVTNMTYSVARQTLGASALFVRASGTVTDPTKLVVVSQSTPAGSKLPYGSVVVVSVIDKRDQNEY